MYATMTTFTVKPGMREIAEKLADELIPDIRGLKGFKIILTQIAEDGTWKQN